MSYDGWFTFDSAEFANHARFAAYTEQLGWWQFDELDAAYGTAAGETYVDPVTDLAPWYDPDEPISGSFYGFYPLSVVGLEDSSRQGDPVESTGEGGIPGRTRHAMKEVTFSGIIAGRGEEAVEYGMRWLRRTLLGGVCSPLETRKQALGVEVQYLAAVPLVGAEEAGFNVLERLARVRRRASVTRGPIQNSTKRLLCGDIVWNVSFTMTIGDPMVYGATKRIFSDMFTDDFAWAGDDGGDFTDFAAYDEVSCGDPTYLPLYDPLCVALVAPPTVPNVPLGCWLPMAEGEDLQRAWVTIPASNITLWGEMLPVITLTNDGSAFDVRDLRLRFFRDPGGSFDPVSEDPCSFVADIVVSYLPTGTMVIDARSEDVHHTTSGGNTRRADSLLFSTNMRPITWPVLDCGMQYVLSVDWRQPTEPTPPAISLDLVPRAV